MEKDLNTEVQNAVSVLKSGGIILYPTDTVWGLGCDATNQEAVSRIYKLKGRGEAQSMICLMNSERMLHYVFNKIPDTAWQIMDFAEKPTTLVLDNPKNVAMNVIAADNSLGVRLVKEGFCYKIIESLKKPITSTSANVSGQPTPTCFNDIHPDIISGVDYVVNLHRGSVCKTPSAIIKLTLDNQVKIIRK